MAEKVWTPVEFKQVATGEARVKLTDPSFQGYELVSTHVITQVLFEGRYEDGLPVFKVNGQTSARLVKVEKDLRRSTR